MALLLLSKIVVEAYTFGQHCNSTKTFVFSASVPSKLANCIHVLMYHSEHHASL